MITEQEVNKRLAEAGGEPVQVQNVNSKKIHTIIVDEDDHRKPYFMYKENLDVRTTPTEKRPKGTRQTVLMKNLVFI